MVLFSFFKMRVFNVYFCILWQIHAFQKSHTNKNHIQKTDKNIRGLRSKLFIFFLKQQQKLYNIDSVKNGQKFILEKNFT